MGLLNVIRHDLWLMASHNRWVLTVMKPSFWLLNLPIRTVLSIAMGKNWPIHQLDVKMLFFMGISKKLYICTNLLGL